MNDEAPESTPPNNQASEVPKSANRWRAVLFAIAGMLVIGGLIAAALAFWPNKETSNQPVSQFQNWLKPAAVIKVGSNRYVSPCSVLPPKTTEEIFGSLSPNSVIQETYEDRSVSTSERVPPQYKCNYNHVSGSGPDIVLEAEQYPNINSPLLDTAILAEASETQTEIDRYKKAVTETHTSDMAINQLLANFQSSLDYYQQITDSHTSGTNTVPKNYILPISDSISGALNDFTYAWQVKNAVYFLGHSPNTVNKASKYSDYSNQQLVDELGKISKAYAAIQTNIYNDSLDQSPAPTITGNTDKYGSTTILESCSILSADVFKNITGKTQNKPVDRTTATKDFTTKRYTQRDKELILPSNDCSRHVSTDVGDISADNTYVRLTMRYGSSTGQATQWVNKNLKVESNDTVLTTKADWAVSFVNPVNPDDTPVVMFRVGPYIGTVVVYTDPAEGDYIEATPEQYTAAINELTTSLKDNIARIE